MLHTRFLRVCEARESDYNSTVDYPRVFVRMWQGWPAILGNTIGSGPGFEIERLVPTRDGHFRISNLPNPNPGNIGPESGSFIGFVEFENISCDHSLLRDRRRVFVDVRPCSD